MCSRGLIMSQSMKSFDCHMTGNGLFSLLLALLLFGGCVKENREECPCRLLVDLSEVDSLKIPVVDISVAGANEFLFSSHKPVGESNEEMILVPRGRTFLNVCYGDEGMTRKEGLYIPVGDECPPVYMYSALVDTDSEFVRETVELRKNHCVMTLCIEGERDDFPFDLTLRGNVCGYDTAGVPLSGNFMYRPKPDENMQFMAVLPRQNDSSLLLDIVDGEEIVRTFAIGEYIKASGYDWTEADLKDVTVGIDYSRTRVSIVVKGWDEVYEFDVVI